VRLVGIVVGADFGGDGEARRHRETDAGHFGQVGTLAAEQGLHGAVAVSLAVAPGVDDLGGLSRFGGILGVFSHRREEGWGGNVEGKRREWGEGCQWRTGFRPSGKRLAVSGWIFWEKWGVGPAAIRARRGGSGWGRSPGLSGPPQGGWGVGRGFAAPSALEYTINRAPTLVRPAAPPLGLRASGQLIDWRSASVRP
jgi:hypothetical protein